MKKSIKNSEICVFGYQFKDKSGYHFSYPIEENYDDPSRDDYVPINLSAQDDLAMFASSYPIPDNGSGTLNDPCSRTYDPFSYSASRGDKVEPIYDSVYPRDNGLDFAPSHLPTMNDFIPINRFAVCSTYQINFPLPNDLIPISRLSPANPLINDIIPISRFSPRGDRVEPIYLFDSLDNYANTVWDPYLHDYVPESAKTTEKEIPTSKPPFNPIKPVETRNYAERCFC